VAKLVAGPGVYICDECIKLCNEIIDQDAGPPSFVATLNDKSEKELFDLMVSFHASHAGIDVSTQLIVGELRARGVSWARIGEALGMTRQSAWERFSGEE
jgi:ATP-dependent Clp protease ATP-binding subunit ClpX